MCWKLAVFDPNFGEKTWTYSDYDGAKYSRFWEDNHSTDSSGFVQHPTIDDFLRRYIEIYAEGGVKYWRRIDAIPNEWNIAPINNV